MTTLFFGPRWDAPRLDDATPTSTPVGAACLVCLEPIAEGDRGLIVGTLDGDGCVGSGPVHAECEQLGIVGHLFGVCGCTGWDSDRAAAQELWRRLETVRGLPW